MGRRQQQCPPSGETSVTILPKESYSSPIPVWLVILKRCPWRLPVQLPASPGNVTGPRDWLETCCSNRVFTSRDAGCPLTWSSSQAFPALSSTGRKRPFAGFGQVTFSREAGLTCLAVVGFGLLIGPQTPLPSLLVTCQARANTRPLNEPSPPLAAHVTSLSLSLPSSIPSLPCSSFHTNTPPRLCLNLPADVVVRSLLES
ncbi:hypothetical protein VTN96DRAFT_8923 [Rasamsonia emersonii]